jgi:enoyl-CoA hydratase
MDIPELRNLIYERRDGAAWITINRPHRRNALTTETYAELRTAFRFANRDDEVDVIVTTGVDPDFSVGGDLNESMGIVSEQDASRFHVYEDSLPYETIRSSRKTTIGMVNGTCLGGALSVLTSMDLIVASERARFGLPEARVGASEPWGPELLAPRISRTHVNWLVYTGEMISAAQALSWGLVNSVVPHDELSAAVLGLLAKVRQTDARARAGFKRHVTARDRLTPTTAAAIDPVDPDAGGVLNWRGYRPSS